MARDHGMRWGDRSTVTAPALQPAVLGPGAAYGQVLWLRHVADCTLSELRHRCGLELPAHCHERAFFSLLLEGRYHERLGMSATTYVPFTICFRPPGVEHSDKLDAVGGRFFKVDVGNSWLCDLSDDARRSPAPDDLHGGPAVWIMTRLLQACGTGQPLQLEVEEDVLKLLGWALAIPDRQERRTPRWMLDVLGYLHANYRQPVSMRELVAVGNVHAVHIARVFKRLHHMTLAEYVFRLRIQHACRLLSDSGTSLSALAAACGFADQSHFTRVFKRITGAAPGVLRGMLFSMPSRQGRPMRPPRREEQDHPHGGVRA